MHAQELQIRGQWLKINEIRKMENPEDQGIGDAGEKLLGQSSIDFSKLGGNAFNVTVNPDGSSKVFEHPKRRVKS